MITPISLTDAAAEHIQKILEKKLNAKGFRLSIKKTGCSGYSYVPEIIDQVKKEDIYFVAQHGLNVFIDSDSLSFVKDLVIDYVDDDAGLKQKKLVFINPNEKNRCGCGESFTIE
ncbi:MAG TPA: iron-sulfur cluster assembly accessory protein [Gammaproteobacteria bacterium]|nr:iron-sulfur cluster assembly accessory protein [Gammaproteobacteria bacterium]